MSAGRVRYARQVARDLRRLGLDAAQTRRRIERALGDQEVAPNADDKPLRGRRPWRRLRLGDLRVIWREATLDDQPLRLVARIVRRGELEAAVRKLS
ncbi:MAG: type II toxin-antitoxin system RelE/ParE family toxin [Thermoleophilaceae bacterium]